MAATIWDAAFKGAAVVLHFAGVQAETSALASVLGTNGKSAGRWTFAIRNDIINPPQGPVVGIATRAMALNTILGSDAFGYGTYSGSGSKIHGGVEVAWASAWNSVGVEAQVYIDFDAGTMGAIYDGVDQGVMFAGISVGTYYPAFSCGSGGGSICASTIRRTLSEFAFAPKVGYTPWDDTPASSGGNFFALI